MAHEERKITKRQNLKKGEKIKKMTERQKKGEYNETGINKDHSKIEKRLIP
jgi:hypothetical protein